MKAYICDACGRTIKDRHEQKMKEFFVAAVPDPLGGVYPQETRIRTTVDLCDDCFHGLHKIAKMKEDDHANG